jgi:hypothetical protein
VDVEGGGEGRVVVDGGGGGTGGGGGSGGGTGGGVRGMWSQAHFVSEKTKERLIFFLKEPRKPTSFIFLFFAFVLLFSSDPSPRAL